MAAIAAAESPASWIQGAGASGEIDLQLELPGNERWAVEIKSGLTPRLEKGFHFARQDLKPACSFVVCSGDERYPLGESVA